MKNPKVFGEVSHTLFLLPSSHQNHLSEQNRGSLRVVSLFGATNKSSRALHQMNSPLDWRLHKGLLTRCVRACFSGNGFWLNTSIPTSTAEEKWLKLKKKAAGDCQTFFTSPYVSIYRGFYKYGWFFFFSACVGTLADLTYIECDTKQHMDMLCKDSSACVYALWHRSRGGDSTKAGNEQRQSD